MPGSEHVPSDACDVGDVAGCSCGAEGGRRFCVDGSFAECVCATPGGNSGEGGAGGAGVEPTCADADESCDASDATCRLAQLSCPSRRLAHTFPFADGVYFVGTLSEGSAGRDAVEQFWPTKRLNYFTGFTTYADSYRFRPKDGALFYHDLQRGILLNGHASGTSDDIVQLTPPCGSSVASEFGFDGAGVLHYRCGNTLRRANGELVARAIVEIAGVMGDGRSVVTRSAADPGGGAYSVLSPSGQELARFYPAELFTGTLTLLPLATTVRVNTAHIAFARTYSEGTEVVVYLVDEDSRFRLVRRAPVLGLGDGQLVVSDGTIFVREYDETSSADERIRAYLPNGASRVVWREAEAVDVRTHGEGGLLAGRAQR
ncbi:MAG TPA: hypothetical protein VHB79_33400 [Polyangiaceae bacterium]|nr:hypothetical protein [Polyangiaceae bacterium]